jgi:hypothetical protein
MVDRLLTGIARVVVHRVPHPGPLVVQAWLWLAANASDTEEKRRCLNAALDLDPENEPASLALLLLDRKRPEN